MEHTHIQNKLTLFPGGLFMKKMPDHLLIETYRRAVELNLHPHFVRLLKLELLHRSLFDKAEKEAVFEKTAL